MAILVGGALLSLALSTLIALHIRRLLRLALLEVCGGDAHASFWASLAGLGVALAGTAAGLPRHEHLQLIGGPYGLLAGADQMRGSLLAILVALALLGVAVGATVARASALRRQEEIYYPALSRHGAARELCDTGSVGALLAGQRARYATGDDRAPCTRGGR